MDIDIDVRYRYFSCSYRAEVRNIYHSKMDVDIDVRSRYLDVGIGLRFGIFTIQQDGYRYRCEI